MDTSSEPTALELHRPPSRRKMVVDIALFQCRLFVDGLRDGLLMPLSLAAGCLGLLSRNRRATRMFYEILELGFRTERWINLFQPVADARWNAIYTRLRELREHLASRGTLDDSLREHLDAIEETVAELESAEPHR